MGTTNLIDWQKEDSYTKNIETKIGGGGETWIIANKSKGRKQIDK